jgi:hypothetical protein
MDPKPDFMAFGPALAALTFGDDFIFLEKPLGDLRKCLLRQQQPCAALAAQLKIPVPGNLLGERQAFLFGGASSLLAFDGGRTLPHPPLAPLIELHFTAEYLVILHGASFNSGSKKPLAIRFMAKHEMC